MQILNYITGYSFPSEERLQNDIEQRQDLIFNDSEAINIRNSLIKELSGRRGLTKQQVKNKIADVVQEKLAYRRSKIRGSYFMLEDYINNLKNKLWRVFKGYKGPKNLFFNSIAFPPEEQKPTLF
ncbi:MAG: hypothetical protein K0S74_1616 [Chlamydiales bacterium]|jgi:hypothetical protein|nr:hypothetical protein [Chlamydiales bacterium]